MGQDKIVPEWSHVFNIDDLGNKPETLHVQADAEVLEQLAQRFDVQAVKRAAADIVLEKQQGGDVVHVSGRFEGQVLQECVVSGDPVVTDLSEDFEGWYGQGGSTISLAKAKQKRDESKGQSEFKMLDESEDPERIVDGVIDLGELVTQHMILAINPYPHAEGALYENGDDQVEKTDFSFKNPFAGLKAWKDKLGEES